MTESKPMLSNAALSGLLGYRMKRAVSIVQADLARTLKPFGLRMLTFTALLLVVENPGVSQSRLAAQMAVERPNLVAVIDELEAAGLIRREPDPADRRVRALRASEAGKVLGARALGAVRAHEARVFAALTPAASRTVAQAMEAIRNSGSEGPA